ncbi:3-hydroxyisobutyrate dehydrogenase-like beta-hydroxyacid dehydrogenase [Novosphingobium chloroacetimidivorans]|uniref:3-hydroxyisobutyrate dehydrogenase-like beta-hydroxyacid dehydrogenase n=1 Tax=Novosphingobium chloroacetimidivorans TaxID=1428314 RepID=A0A7W7KA66_9SPHN|nr:NAD(P)-dependent oxidoreductase [Novosphingobium chloroacetimidivorans]MBB4858363.1 3-hydroxyisobutyrate dehydrogenase-like beta-hydroxyacid dehydrogenase [Novosphingobium chloroacetimidivorans]
MADETAAPVLGFIGLGVMGSGMCANAVRKHAAPLYAFDMNPDALAAQVANGAVAAASVGEVAKGAQVIFLSLPGGKQVHAVSQEIAEHAAPGTIVVDLSTTSVAEAREVAGLLLDRGLAFADAPVARTRQAAIDGTLSIMVGASEDLFARIKPLLGYMGSDVTLCGEVGCGQVVKLINNTLLFEQVAAIAELMVVAERAGVAPDKLIEAVGLGSGNSFALQTHAKKAMAPRDFPAKAFPMAYAVKDIGYTIELAEQMGVEPRLPRLVTEYYQAAIDQGIGEKYFPAIIEVVDRK